MTLIELKNLIAGKLGISVSSIHVEDFKSFAVRFSYHGNTYRVTTNLSVEKVDGAVDSDARQLEKLLRGEQWDGTGLPPVGTECEVIAHNNRWGMTAGVVYKGTLVAHSGDDFWFRSEDNVNFISRNDKVDFRPPRTEREKAIEQMIKVFSSNAAPGTTHAIVAIYDAIVAGKIDGLGKVG